MKIGQIRLEGLNKTEPEVIRQWVLTKPGDYLRDYDPVFTMEQLLNLRIFSRIELRLVENPSSSAGNNPTVDVVIQVKEKWSLFPVPFFYQTNDTKIGGLLLVDSNVGGYNKGATVGGVVSNRGWQYITGYVDPNIGYTPWFGQIRSTGGSIFTENARPDGEVFQSYQQERFDILYQTGYTLDHVFSPTWTGGIYKVDIPVAQNNDKLNPPPPATAFYQGIKFIFNNTLNRNYYDAGLRSSLEYQRGFGLAGTNAGFHNFKTENRYTFESIYHQTVSFGLYGGWSNLPQVLEHRLGGLEGSRPLPFALVSADNYFNTGLDYQIPLFQLTWGTVTTVQFVEYGFYNRNEEPTTHFWGPGMGFRFYLKDLTIPAVGIDAGYEVVTGALNFSFYIGFKPTR